MPKPKLLLNISIPELAQSAAELPAAGVGLLRAEFMALQMGRHPHVLLEDEGSDAYVAFFREGLQQVASAFYPRPVTYRTCDLKTSEYRSLEGGERFEPEEMNPMLGRRGVYRYTREQAAFELELRAVVESRAAGLDNVRLMLPFVRTVEELREARAIVGASGLLDQPGFQLWAMAEVPATALLPGSFAAEVDGLSIGSNDLVQLVLGIDRDSPELSRAYSGRDPAVLEALRRIIEGAHEQGKPASICGDAPAEDPELFELVVALGIDAISVAPHRFAEAAALLEGRPGVPAT